MSGPQCLSLPPGRPARTPAERELAQALVRHGAARSQMYEAVQAATKAHATLLSSFAQHGATHPWTDGALRTWEAALARKAVAADEVKNADEHLVGAWRALAHDDATRCASSEVRHG